MASESFDKKVKSPYWLRLSIILPLLWIIVVSGIMLFLMQVDKSKKNQIDTLKKNVLQNAISHFKDIVTVRKWNASHGGVYIKQHDEIQPNPYLQNNVAYTDKNEMLIKVNPAWMTRQISEISNASRKEQYKLTSLKPINPSNAPKKFESNALKYLDKNRGQRFYYQFGTKQTFQFLGALYVEQACMKCHAEQGYNIGDVRGGVSISLPLEGYYHSKKLIEMQTQQIKLGIQIFGFLFGVLLSFLIISIIRHHKHLTTINDELEDIVLKRTLELQELNDTLEDRVQEEIEKNKLKEEMMILQSRHAAMGEMIGMIAHQWRQPVATLSMIANKMMMDIGFDEVDLQKFEKDAEEIITQSIYLSKTIDDFTNFFKPNKQKEFFSPNSVLQDALEIIEQSITNNGIELKITSTTQKLISGYPHELMQVYLNLLKNAKEALLQMDTKEKIITVCIYEESDGIVTTICDNGAGIDPTIRKEIFVPYFTTKEQFNGTGLGLYMSKIIIENHLLGKLKIDEQASETCFKIWLPFFEV